MREVGDVHRELFARSGELYGDLVRAKFAACLDVSDGEYETALAARAMHLEKAQEALNGCDLLLTPTLPIVPPADDAAELAVRARDDAIRVSGQRPRLAGASVAVR